MLIHMSMINIVVTKLDKANNLPQDTYVDKRFTSSGFLTCQFSRMNPKISSYSNNAHSYTVFPGQ
jgi:hypothetical protein